VGHFLGGLQVQPEPFFRGLQVEPETRPRRGANGLAVARFPNEQPVFREYSVYCQDYKIYGSNGTINAAQLKLRRGVLGLL
jgi:hypothetical protein